MSEIIFWMRVTHYSARWITLCEERRRTRGYTLNSRLTEQLTDCGNLNIPTEARAILPIVTEQPTNAVDEWFSAMRAWRERVSMAASAQACSPQCNFLFARHSSVTREYLSDGEHLTSYKPDFRTESSRCSRNASTITTISKSHVWRFKNGMVRHETGCVRVLIERPLGFLFPAVPHDPRHIKLCESIDSPLYIV